MENRGKDGASYFNGRFATCGRPGSVSDGHRISSASGRNCELYAGGNGKAGAGEVVHGSFL
ncbi:hypothetical protein SDC9_170874 [bioreactor metagenome]|uniref:Uncharacterized protein n=1 Tax=bioreactor metagenome TaxID=1076179 RepID=A0A645GBJ2_9ZZZZ